MSFVNDFISLLPFTPNAGQLSAINEISLFETSDCVQDEAFMLCGYAGTGKTSLVSTLLRMRSLRALPTVLLAPTGRAAKVLAAYSGHAAYTIHKHIYRQQAAGVERFTIADNKYQDTLFIVDEASMIANDGGGAFGTGRLLDDLIEYIFSGSRCRLLLLGDTAQLPPVGQTDSPALNAEYVAAYGIKVTRVMLTEVARQALESGILFNATALRMVLMTGKTDDDYVFDMGYADVVKLQGRDFVETIEQSYQTVGVEETMVIVRTNRRANLYNQGIRARILWREDKVENGDRIMVTKNNYFFTEQYDGMDFIANGDILEIKRIAHQREMYGMTFADVSLRSIDYDWEIDVVALLDSIGVDSPEAQRQLQNALFERIAEDYPELSRNRRKLVKQVMQTPYYNALQFKHAYAATCHKCQGGQWKHVYIDRGLLQPEQINEQYFRWLYTAVTRASERLYLINF